MNLSLKRRKPIVYISLGIYLALSTFIIIESCMGDVLSSLQSTFFADIAKNIVNEVNPAVAPKVIEPTGFGEIIDTSFLGKDEDDIPKVAIGTTTRLTIPVLYPIKQSNEVYNRAFSVTKALGNQEDYMITSVSNFISNTNNITVYLTTIGQHDDIYSIDIATGEGLSTTYTFHIVDLEAPRDYITYPTHYDETLNRIDLKIGETSIIDLQLLDEKQKDPYLRRYYDVTLLSRSSSNEEVASIDEYGVIHGLSEGNATISYGKESYEVHVDHDAISMPEENSLSLAISNEGKANPSLLDYDYVYEEKENPDDYSVLIYPSFSNQVLEDQGIIYSLDNELHGKIGPHHYDEDGRPIYEDHKHRPCVRVSGYRKKGEVTLKAKSTADPRLEATLTLNVGEALPTSMSLNHSKPVSLSVNDQKSITASFSPKNVFNKSIHVTCDDDSLITIHNNDSSSVNIVGKAIGTTKIHVVSNANPELTAEIDISTYIKETINESNYSQFHTFVRKYIGHFSLFLVTAIFGMIFCYFYIDDLKFWWAMLVANLLTGFSSAALSEWIQYYIPTRGGSWVDIGIDFGGFLIGTLLTFGVLALIRYIKMKKHRKN